MPYITSVERIGIEKGMEKGMKKGMEKGQRSIVYRLLRNRLGELSDPIVVQLDSISIDQIQSLSDEIFNLETIADLTTWLTGQQNI